MEGIIKKINELYELEVSFSERVEKGFLSDNYFLSDGKTRFFLKKYRFDNPNRVAEVRASKKYFSDGGIPIILPIPLLGGKTFFEYENSYYALFPFVEGKHRERGELTETAIISLGRMLGKIHLLGKESKLLIEDRFKIKNKEETLNKIENILTKVSEINSPSDFDRVALENMRMKKNLLLENTMTFESLGLSCDHLIHGDYLEHNVFFDEDDSVKWVFDLEKTNYSPRTYELFRSMIYGLFSTDVTGVDLENARKYMDAYSGVYPISKDEIRRGLQLYFVKTIHSFWVESEHYLKGNTRVDHFLFDDHRRIKYLSKNLDELINVLTE
ncbi:MAG: phosphotransferase [Candidatus Paceibacterota bacterium]